MFRFKRARPNSAKNRRPTASYHSQGINHQNRVRVFPYSHWLFSSIFQSSLMTKNLAERVTTKAIAGDKFWKNANPSHDFYVRCLGSLRAKLRANHQIVIPYKFVLKKYTLAKRKSLFLLPKLCFQFLPRFVVFTIKELSGKIFFQKKTDKIILLFLVTNFKLKLNIRKTGTNTWVQREYHSQRQCCI